MVLNSAVEDLVTRDASFYQQRCRPQLRRQDEAACWSLCRRHDNCVTNSQALWPVKRTANGPLLQRGGHACNFRSGISVLASITLWLRTKNKSKMCLRFSPAIAKESVGPRKNAIFGTRRCRRGRQSSVVDRLIASLTAGLPNGPATLQINRGHFYLNVLSVK